jgi:MATE family multidrug resistance protein
MGSTFFTGWREILKLAWPLIVANSFWNIQLTVDRIFLGEYSTETLGASIAAASVFWAPMALLQQTAAYVTTFVAQYFGANQKHMLGTTLWHAIYVSFLGGLLFLLLIPFSQHIFNFIDHSETLKPLEIDYFNALCWSALPTALVAAVSGFFSGIGRSQVTMWINGVGVIANVIFNYTLIFGHWGAPELGIAGAGYATALANLVSAIFALSLLLRKKNEREMKVLSGWRWNNDLLKRFLKFGVPSGMQWALEGLAFTIFLLFIGRLPNGDAALSASSIAVTALQLAVLPALGVAQAVTILVGQMLGHNEPDKAEKHARMGVKISAVYIVTIGITFITAPDFYLQWFQNSEKPMFWTEVQTITRYLLMFVAFFTSFDSLNLVLSFALKGAGDTRFVSLVALLLPWPIMVIPTYLMQDWSGGVYWAWGAASCYGVTQALVFWRRFEGGLWKKMSVIR